MTDAAAALRAAADVGPYFAVDPVADGPAWRRFAHLVNDPAVVRERVGVVRAALASRCGVDTDVIEQRVAASLHSLAVAARLLAPTFAAAVLTGTVPVLDVDRVRWQEVAGGPVPMAFLDPPGESADEPGELAELLDASVLRSVVVPLVEVFSAEFLLSPKVLWGNVASALGGAATMLTAGGDHGERALAVAEALLGRGTLRGHGRYDGAGPDRFFVRASCCLFYRIPGGGLCGDCVLAHRQTIAGDGAF